MENLVLRKIEIEETIVKYDFDATGCLSSFFKSRTMFCDFGMDVSNIPKSILSIPFVGAFVALAWIVDANIWVPELDRTFYEALKSVKNAFQEMHYDYTLKGRLVPSVLVGNIVEKSNSSMLLFGGGIDAHCSLIRNRGEISHLINIQGWYESIDDENRVADKEKKHCEQVAMSNGIQSLFVKSNFASILKSDQIDRRYRVALHESWWHGFQHAMAFITIAIVPAFLKGISNLIIGSSNTVGDQVACASDITTDSEYRFACYGSVIHDGFELSRQQKVEIIVQYQKKSQKPYPLEVCSFNDHNCCSCEKCFRTIIEIIAEGGEISDYNFNIEEPLMCYFEKVMYNHLGLWGMDFERKIYWNSTFARIHENWDNIKEKDFCNWLLNFDFDKAKRQGLIRYYRQNFFSILKRKLHLSK